MYQQQPNGVTLLSLIVDQRCVPDNDFLPHRMRNFILDTVLDVVHVAWWHQPDAENTEDVPEPLLHQLELHVITSSAPQPSCSLQRFDQELTCHHILPPTSVLHLDAIKDAFAAAFQLPPDAPMSLPPAVTGGQVGTIRDIILRKTSAPASHQNNNLSSNIRHAHPHDLHVVLVTTVFDSKDFSARIASALPPLISMSPCTRVSVLYMDHLAKSISALSLGPAITVQRFTLTAPPRRCITKMMRPILEQWLEQRLTPSALPVVLHVGDRSIPCRASCAVVSPLSRWNLPQQAATSTAVVRGWSVHENMYQDCSASPPPAGGLHGVAMHRLRVERCVSCDDVDASSLTGDAWYITPVLSVSAYSAYNSSVGHDPSDPTWKTASSGVGWWKALVDASATVSSRAPLNSCEPPRRETSASTPTALILSSAGGSFCSNQHTIGLHAHEFIGMFAPDGSSMLLRALVPYELVREAPAPLAYPIRTTEAMTDEVRQLLVVSASGGPGWYHGGVTAVLGALHAQEIHRSLQVISVNPSRSGKFASMRSSKVALPLSSARNPPLVSEGGGCATRPLHRSAGTMGKKSPFVS